MGVARAPAGSEAFQSSFPVSTSNARKARSSVAPTNTRPDAVTIGPPRFGDPEPGGAAGAPSFSAGIVPRGTSQRIRPVSRLTATREPNGGRVQGRPVG